MKPRSPFSRLSMRIEGEKNSALENARGRIVLIVALFMMSYIVIAARLVDATLIQGMLHNGEETSVLDKSREQDRQNQSSKRGDIVDRNGVVLATSLKTASLYADQKLMLDATYTAQELVKIFPDMAYGDTLKKLQGQKRFVWIKRNLTPDEQTKILQIGEPGLAFDYDYRRIYPQGALTAHMVGYTDVDGRGLGGVERSFHKLLSTQKDEAMRLTIDVRLQHILRRETQKAITDFNGIAGAGLIMDVRSGDVLAAVSLPDFDPHDPQGGGDDQRKFNRVTLGVYELGSTFKIFSTTAFLEKFKTLDARFDARTPLYRYRRVINDFHPERRVLTLPEVFMLSSNIGTALMGEKVGTESLKSLYKDLGLMSKMAFDIDEIGRPLMPYPWQEISTLTASYGHGIAVSPLQLTVAVSAIVNGGTMVKPRLVLPDEDNEPRVQKQIRVISKDTSLKMRQLLRLVVKDGTASKANVTGYDVGGKTGTAEKNINGRYVGDKRISSFIGVFPMHDPQYAVFIMVDEPKPNKSSYGYATAGWVSAPAVGHVIGSMGPLLNMKPADPSVDIAEPLQNYIYKAGGQ
jgi:cell division protein FtsI (penicillin-binding protein 3)